MKIGDLPNGSPDCPLIRIYGNEREDLIRLQQAFKQLWKGVSEEISLDELRGFQSKGGCKLLAAVDKKDFGVTTVEEIHFILKLRAERWRDLADMIAPLVNTEEGTFFQWLDETSPISLLVTTSPEGEWSLGE